MHNFVKHQGSQQVCVKMNLKYAYKVSFKNSTEQPKY